MKNKIVFSPRSFPFDYDEQSFLQAEFEELNKAFDVSIISAANMTNGTPIPEYGEYNNLVLELDNIDYQQMSRIQRIISGLKSLFQPLVIRESIHIISTKKHVIMRLYQMFLFYIYSQRFANEVEKLDNIDLAANCIYYTYWYDVQTFGFMLLKKKYPNIRIVSRAHGFDLYEVQRPGFYQPFRKWMDMRITKLFFISQNGKEYYENHFATKNYNPNKYVLRYLGSEGREIYSPENKTKVFHIVSCSSLIGIKRVELIIQALSIVPDDISVEWDHFGDGNMYDELSKLAEKLLNDKKNILYHFNGLVSNKEIHSFYQINAIDCFINVSSTEGLPISIQEALAYGIPIIASNVGGNAELINNNGRLLSENPAPNEICDALVWLFRMNSEFRHNLHMNSMILWKSKFDARKNAKIIVQDIQLLLDDDRD